MNNCILIFHILFIAGVTLFALRLGKEALISWIALLGVVSNLFIQKEVSLFGLSATCTDSLAVGYLLGLNLIQEFFGQKAARKTVAVAFFMAATFFFLSLFHLSYAPGLHDTSQNHYSYLLNPIPRILISSLFSFFFVQIIDLSLFSYLRTRMKGRFFPLRAFCSSFLCEGIDTLLFTLLALYGTHSSLGTLIIVSFGIKVITLLLATPFLYLTKKIGHEHV